MKLFNSIKKSDLILVVSTIIISVALAYFYDKAVFIVAFFALILLTIVTFMKVEVAILGTLIWPYFQYFFTRDLKILPEFFTLLDECLLTSILIYLGWNLLQRKLKIKLSYFDAFLAAFILLGALSSVLNKNPFPNTILGFRCYLQYIVLYYAISFLKLSDGFCRFIMKTMLALVLIQVPFTIFQYFTWSPSSLVNDHADSAYGTFSFGAANMLGILMLTFIFYLFKNKNNIPILLNCFLLALLSFSLVLAHSKISYILLILLLIFDNIASFNVKLSSTKILLTLFGLFVVVKLALLVSDDIAYLLSYDNFMIIIENQMEDKEGGGRIMYLLLTFTVLYKYAFSYLIGLGPGMYSSYAGITLKSHYLVDILNIDLEHRGTRLDPDIIGILGEYGYLGFLFFSLMIAVLFVRKFKVSSLPQPGYWNDYAAWFKLFTIIFYLGAFVNGIWQAQFFSVTYWVAAGIFNKKYLETL